MAYMRGSKNTAPLWRTSQSMLIYDWSRPPTPASAGSAIPIYPSYPRYIRTYGVVGAQPGGTGGIPNALHGPISTFEHPQTGQRLARSATYDHAIATPTYLTCALGA